MSKNEHKYTHAFLCIPNIGSETLKSFALHFGSIEKAWFASPEEIHTLPKMKSEKKEEIVAGRKKVNPDEEWQKFLGQDIKLLLLDDPEFPPLLRQIPDAPYTLYVQGNFDWIKQIPMIAIVGSRKFTPYGEQVAARLSADLTRAGILVVSGLAFGIDSVSHEAALEAGGETIAILGSGLHQISPPSHIPLAEKIMTRGAVVSEYPPSMEGSHWSFAVRNRIIAGMTLGTIVIEAAEKSGSLITARLALEYNREVFAVPGSIFSPYSIGTNSLIKRGAKVVTGIQDILEEFSSELIRKTTAGDTAQISHTDLSPEEQKILAVLSHEPIHIDKIIKAATLQTATASSLLSLLEIKGLAKNTGGMHYVRL